MDFRQITMMQKIKSGMDRFRANLLSAALNIEKSARRTTKFHTPTEFAQLFSENCSKR